MPYYRGIKRIPAPKSSSLAGEIKIYGVSNHRKATYDIVNEIEAESKLATHS
jgi:hypothetical protein